MKIISGGQTGIDRAALDVALKSGIECGGWCPAGRLDEFGKIPDRYPLKELEQRDKAGRSPDRPGGLETVPWENNDRFAERTLQNVKDSDGTVVIYFSELGGGSAFTVECCEQLNRPHLVMDAHTTSTEDAAEKITSFVNEHSIRVLNVAGPRQSEWPAGYDYAISVLQGFLHRATRI